MDPRPLEGKRVLVTRPRRQAQEMTDAIKRLGGDPLVLPLLRIEPADDTGALDALLAGGLPVDAVVFASANAVKAVFDRCAALQMSSSLWEGKELYAVGERTGDALRAYGRVPTATPAEFSGEALAALLTARDLRGKRFLFPRGDLGKDTVQHAVQSAGAITQAVSVYRTVGPDDETAGQLRAAVLDGTAQIVTFASPSAVRFFCALFAPAEFEQIRAELIIGVIGEPTAREACDRGLPVHVRAAEATAIGLVDALGRFCASIHSSR